MLKSVIRNDLTSFESSNNTITRRIKRTSIKLLFRHFIWRIGIWSNGFFKEWVKEFSPKIVMIQSGDTAFTHDIARIIAAKYNAKLVFFNTEGVFFQKQICPYKGFLDYIFSPLYKRVYRRSYSRAMRRAVYAFYLNKLIQKHNDEVFDVPSCVIYNTTSIHLDSFDSFINISEPIVSYFGNMGYDRSKVLVEVANLLKSLKQNIKFNVYGKGLPEAIKRLEGCPNMNYQGFIPYSKIIDVIHKSDIVLHVESRDKKHAEVLKYGFSTKIADCLASGKPFLLYSSKEIACAQYLIENDCAWVVDNPDQFKVAVRSILSDEDERKRRLTNAHLIAEKNHSINQNCKVFQEQLLRLGNYEFPRIIEGVD